jgi:Xaa-Pro aminopeptidase
MLKVTYYALTTALLALAPAVDAGAGDADTKPDFPAEEFAARRAKVAEGIGPGAVAVLQGAPPVKGFEVFRQANEFYYLTGLAVPGAYVTIDGSGGATRLYLPRRDPRLERAEGPVLSADDADAVKKLTGASEVHPIDSLSEHVAGGRMRVLYTPFSPGYGRYPSRAVFASANRRQANDPWDARPSREAHFVSLL